MKHGDAKKEEVDYQNLKEHKRRDVKAKYEKAKRAECRRRQDEEARKKRGVGSSDDGSSSVRR